MNQHQLNEFYHERIKQLKQQFAWQFYKQFYYELYNHIYLHIYKQVDEELYWYITDQIKEDLK